ncbi:MAG: chemotaxis protein CheA [Candidatus Hydrogenedentota bacterium]|nr:MAG: chemotaxis protein CheA [Candidatus Hydrogenedentota bacterium]
MVQVDKEELKIFLDELNENLNFLDDAILNLEENPDDKDTLEEIFRVAHTVKGSAGFLGLDNLVNLGHSMENVFMKIQQGEAKATPEAVNLLLESKDRISAIGKALADGEDAEKIDTSDLVKKIDGLLQDTSSQKEDPSDQEEHLAKESSGLSFPPGTKLIRVWISPHEVVPSIRAFLIRKKISDIAEILLQEPDEEEVESDAFAEQDEKEVKFYVKTDVPDSEIPSRIRVDLIEKIEVSDVSTEDQPSDTMSDEEINTQIQMAQKEKEAEEKDQKEEQKKTKQATTTVELSDSVRVPVSRLDTLLNLVGEMVIANSGFLQIQDQLRQIPGQEDLFRNVRDRVKDLYRISSDIQELVMKSRLVPIGQVFNRFRRFVRDYAQKSGKKIHLTLVGEETEIDKKIIDEIIKPLTHLVRNALDHGIEKPEERLAKGKPEEGQLTLTAFQEGNYINIVIQDDGRGLDYHKIMTKAVAKGIISKEEAEYMSEEDLASLIFRPGFSTKDEVTDISGRGVGMDVVKRSVENLNGTIDIDSFIDRGTTITIKLPLTLAILNALMVRIGQERMSIPMASIVETQNITLDQIITVEGNEMVRLRDTLIPIIRINELFDMEADDHQEGEEIPIIIVENNDQLIAFLVDEFIVRQEMVIKSLAEHYRPIEGISGASILGDGSIILILDVHGLIQLHRNKGGLEGTDSAIAIAPPSKDLRLYLDEKTVQKQETDQTKKEEEKPQEIQKQENNLTQKQPTEEPTITEGEKIILKDAINEALAKKTEDEPLIMPKTEIKPQVSLLEWENLEKLQKIFEPEYAELLKDWLRQGNERAEKSMHHLTGSESIHIGTTKAKKMRIQSPEELFKKIHTFQSDAVDFMLPILPMHGSLHFLMTRNNADKLVELLWKKANIEAPEGMKYEPLFELTNLIGSAYTNSLTQVTDILIEPGVPSLLKSADDIKTEIEQSMSGQQFRVLYVENKILWDDESVLAELILVIPEIKVLQNIK